MPGKPINEFSSGLTMNSNEQFIVATYFLQCLLSLGIDDEVRSIMIGDGKIIKLMCT